MKLLLRAVVALETLVAPHVGAWIETVKEKWGTHVERVAPHVGAWIETRSENLVRISAAVAPHVGAWIETLVKPS